jgi:hypothetical protein
MQGIRVEVIDDAAPGVPVVTKTTDADGKIPEFCAVKLTNGHTYTVRAKIPISITDTVFANKSCSEITSSDCIVNLKSYFAVTNAFSPMPMTAVEMPDSTAGAYGGEIGNPNCDGIVNMNDLMSIKPAFKTAAGDCCYRPWADFNMDGAINMTDIGVVKKHFNYIVGSAPSNAALCKSKFAPLPACCPGKCNPATCN